MSQYPAAPPAARGPADPVEVAIALIWAEGRVLVGRRPSYKPLPGLWEFPGGKIRPGESPVDALHRELWEELNARVRIAAPLPPLLHPAPSQAIRLHPFICRLLDPPGPGSDGALSSWAHDQLRWVPADELDSLSFPPANAPLIARLRGMQIHAGSPLAARE